MAIGKTRNKPSGRHTRLTAQIDFDPRFNQLQKELWKHANLSSSQVALIICDSQGVTYLAGTTAFQGYLEKWVPEKVRHEARAVAVSAAAEKIVRRKRGYSSSSYHNDDFDHEFNHNVYIINDEYDDDEDDDDDDDDDDEDFNMDSDMGIKRPADETIERLSKRTKGHSAHTNRKSIITQTAGDKEKYSDISQYKPIRLGDSAAVENYYMTRLRQMQQVICKAIAKAWIKVIEPQKQIVFPYKNGDEKKPGWWPHGVRHREPDHLVKFERMILLITIIRSRIVTIAELMKATDKIVPQMPSERMALLNELYRVAKEEERMDMGNLSPNTICFVAHSESIMCKIVKEKTGLSQNKPDTKDAVPTEVDNSVHTESEDVLSVEREDGSRVETDSIVCIDTDDAVHIENSHSEIDDNSYVVFEDSDCEYINLEDNDCEDINLKDRDCVDIKDQNDEESLIGVNTLIQIAHSENLSAIQRRIGSHGRRRYSGHRYSSPTTTQNFPINQQLLDTDPAAMPVIHCPDPQVLQSVKHQSPSDAILLPAISPKNATSSLSFPDISSEQSHISSHGDPPWCHCRLPRDQHLDNHELLRDSTANLFRSSPTNLATHHGVQLPPSQSAPVHPPGRFYPILPLGLSHPKSHKPA